MTYLGQTDIYRQMTYLDNRHLLTDDIFRTRQTFIDNIYRQMTFRTKDIYTQMTYLEQKTFIDK